MDKDKIREIIKDINVKELIEKETGVSFSRNNTMCCPIHHEKTPSFSYNSKTNRFKCFACECSGDAIDFIQAYRGVDFIQACKYLGLEVDEDRAATEALKDRIIEFALKYRKDFTFKAIYPFKDVNGNILYYKVKLVNKEKPSCKITPYYSVVDGEIRAERNCPEVPYNLPGVINSLQNRYPVLVVEGEKDVDTLKSFGYQAISIKNVANGYDFSFMRNSNVYFIGDTGEAGDKYRKFVKNSIFDYAESYHEVKLKGIKDLGDNKDVTDWIVTGNTKKDLQTCMYKSLDLKNENELQQDCNGIYKTVFKKIEGEIEKIKVYITNFTLLEAKKISYIDEDKEGIELLCVTKDGFIEKRIGETSVFNDVRTFKTFLGRMSLNFKGDIKDLSRFQEWIDDYIINETQILYTGVKFKDGMFITQEGTTTKDKYIRSTTANVDIPTDINGIDLITKEELQELLPHLFKYNSLNNCICILGTIIHNFCYELAKKNGVKLHHLMVIGESGAGKSTLKRDVIAPLLGYPSGYEGMAIDNITKFALLKAVSNGNLTKVFDEYKPSQMNSNILSMVSSIFRNLYDGMDAERGKKDQTTIIYKLTTPIVVFGEENTHQTEKAVMERSLICYLSKSTRPTDGIKSIEYLTSHRDTIVKLSNLIVNEVLNMTNADYMERRNFYKGISPLKDRLLNTHVNACVGMDVLNSAISRVGVKLIDMDYIGAVADTIKANVMNDGEELNADYEDMLVKFNDVMETYYDLRDDENIIYIDGSNNKTYIRVAHMIDRLSKYIKDYGIEFKLLSKNDFIKRCEAAGYITCKSKGVKVNGNNIRYQEFDTDKLSRLGCSEMIPRNYDNAKLSLVK